MTKKFDGNIEEGDEVLIRGTVDNVMNFTDETSISVKIEGQYVSVGLERISELIKADFKIGDLITAHDHSGEFEILCIYNKMVFAARLGDRFCVMQPVKYIRKVKND